MKPETDFQASRRDISLVRRTLNHLTATQKITCIAVVVIVAFIWWRLLQRLLAFGKGMDYSGLHTLGAQTVTLLQQYNPFFWWGLVILISLILVYLLYGFVVRTQHRVRRKLLTRATVERLASQLSEPALEVLSWAWHDRRHPLSVGDLQRALAEMRSGRAGKITLARDHQALLNASLKEKND